MPGWNSCRYLLGLPGSGKTTLAIALAGADVRAGRIVLCHDPHGQYPCPAFSVAALAAALDAGAAIPRAMRVGGHDAAPVTALACGIARRARRPVSLYLDEMSVAVETPGVASQRERILLTGRRHIGAGLGLTLLAQDIGVTGALWLRLATDLYLFRLSDARRIDQLERTASVTGLHAVLPGLARYSYLHCRPGDELARRTT